MALFERVAIVGFGLIGSSLARNIRKNGTARHIVAIDCEEEVCRKAVALGLADESWMDIRKGIEECDLVVLAVPPGACGNAARQMRHTLRHGAIVTDTASVKESVIAAIMPQIPDRALYVPAHPLAGSERSGQDSGSETLFHGRYCLITPLPHTDIRALEKITALWESCGAIIEIMDPKRHDLTVAMTSHLPYLLACTLIGTIAGLEQDKKQEFIRFSASGFADFSRIASSNPLMGRDIFLNNRDSILETLDSFTRNLSFLREGIEQGDGDYLQNIFSGVRTIRNGAIGATAREFQEPRTAAAHSQTSRGSGS